MDWRVLIYSSDDKHPDLLLTHTPRHSIMQGVDTPRLHTVIVYFCEHNGLCRQGKAQSKLDLQ